MKFVIVESNPVVAQDLSEMLSLRYPQSETLHLPSLTEAEAAAQLSACDGLFLRMAPAHFMDRLHEAVAGATDAPVFVLHDTAEAVAEIAANVIQVPMPFTDDIILSALRQLAGPAPR